MKSLRQYGSSWQWTLLAVLVSLGAMAIVLPATAEPVTKMIGVAAIGCLLWGIWRLMQE